jgi:hypothetical protein
MWPSRSCCCRRPAPRSTSTAISRCAGMRSGSWCWRCRGWSRWSNRTVDRARGNPGRPVAAKPARGALTEQCELALLYLDCREQSMEAIATRVRGDEQTVETVRRKAVEETGLRIRELAPVVVCFSSLGISTKRLAPLPCTLFVGRPRRQWRRPVRMNWRT